MHAESQPHDSAQETNAHERRVQDAAERLPEGAPPPKRASRTLSIVVGVAILIAVLAAAWAAFYFGRTPGLIVAILLLVAYAVYGARPLFIAIFLREKEVEQVERRVSKAEDPPEVIRRED